MNGFLLPVMVGEEEEVLCRLLDFMEFLCAEWLVESWNEKPRQLILLGTPQAFV